MPLATLEDYERLGEHLYAIDDMLGDFAAQYGYTAYGPISGGRYPNRRITREEVIGPNVQLSRTIHIAMDEQSNGERFDRFFPEIPYTIFGGAGIDDHHQHLRWHSPFLHTRHIPFSLLVIKLPIYLDWFHNYLSRITAEQIYACNCTSTLG